MEPSWVKIAAQFGIPVVLLALAIYLAVKFVDKKLWPLLVKQIEDAKAERRADLEHAKAERAAFIETIRTRDVILAELTERHGKAFELITFELKGLHTKIDNGSHKKPNASTR
jgi:hypothetical protein